MRSIGQQRAKFDPRQGNCYRPPNSILNGVSDGLFSVFFAREAMFAQDFFGFRILPFVSECVGIDHADLCHEKNDATQQSHRHEYDATHSDNSLPNRRHRRFAQMGGAFGGELVDTGGSLAVEEGGVRGGGALVGHGVASRGLGP